MHERSSLLTASMSKPKLKLLQAVRKPFALCGQRWSHLFALNVPRVQRPRAEQRRVKEAANQAGLGSNVPAFPASKAKPRFCSLHFGSACSQVWLTLTLAQQPVSFRQHRMPASATSTARVQHRRTVVLVLMCAGRDRCETSCEQELGRHMDTTGLAIDV